MAQWADLINEALADIGAAAGPGQTISTTAQTDAFLRLQQMLDAWSVDPLLALYQVQHGSFPFTANSYAYTLGNGGTFSIAAAPVRVTGGSSVYTLGSLGIFRRPMRLISIDEFAKEVSDPGASVGLLPSILGADRAFPSINLRVWPTPTSATASIELNWWTVIPAPVNVTDTVTMPPGFQLAIQKNLALRLYPQYARERGIDPVLQADATYTMGLIRQVNQAMLAEGQPAQQAPNPPSAG
jgi:hypothetical protein